MATDDRLLPPDEIPTTLWERATETLLLPSAVSKAYVAYIDHLNLRDVAANRSTGDGPVGGPTQESADQHLAQSFDGSVARAMLAVLDPKSEGGSTSNAFVKATAGTTLAITDAPCGAGAAALSFLSTIAELRAAGTLPREPLDVKLVGGELSKYAIAHARWLSDELRSALEMQAIFLDETFLEWDVLDSLSTSNLVKATTVHGAKCSSKLLVIANFNGFLVKEKKQKEARQQLDELLRYASGKESMAIWIEPDMNRATGDGGLFSWLYGLFRSAWSTFARVDPGSTTQQPMFRSSANFQLPLSPQASARVRLAVMPIDLSRMPTP